MTDKTIKNSRFSKLSKKLRTLQGLLFLTPQEKSFINFSKNKWKKISNPSADNPHILVDQMFYDIYIWELSYITNFLKKKYALNSRHFHFIAREKKFLHYFFKFLRKFSKINAIYNSFGSSYGLGQTYYKKSDDICAGLNFVSKRELLKYEIEGILVGDLIYDTYLRTYEAPTVDLKDPRLKTVLLNAHDIFYSCKKYLDEENVQKIIVSHAVYIQYGILARIALAKGIDVYNPLWERVLKKLSIDHFVPSPRHHLYPSIFQELDDKSILRNKAKLILESRLRGEVDRGIAYMEKSSFGGHSANAEKVFLNNGNPKIAMMLHCFYDAPHIYRHMVFEDFYEWVDLVFTIMGDMNVDFIVKPHPNAKPYNQGIIKNLLVKHPYIRLVDKHTSNSQIISEGVELILTVYGTASHEFSYQDINVLVAGDHPGAEYNFVHQPKDRIEYEQCLRNPRDIKIKIDKSEIEEFFYMHYLFSGFGRIQGNNDIFGIRQRNFRTIDPNIFIELINDAQQGKFDNAFSAYEEAFNQVD
jgi:hypothetical protein|tara:strand:+ start:2866 stop:4449 length:1584 start_codon:yes stop_codon:yes gene_type:complete